MFLNSTTIPEIYDYQNGLSLLAGVLILIIGLFGVITNSSIIFIFYKERSERTSFNLICVFRAISNVIILSATFLSVFFPKTLVGYQFYHPALESSLIHLSLTLYLGNEYQIVLVASNRFCSLFFPHWYSIAWGIGPTFIYLTLIYVYRLVKVYFELYDQIVEGCFTSYSSELLLWIYDSNPTCKNEGDILEVITYTFIIMTFVNVITFLKIISFYWSRRSQTMDKETRKRISRNTVLFFQTMLQDSLYLIDLTFTFKLSGLSNHRLWTFISGTLVWECLHSIDGFIMIMFNERLSFLKKRFQPTPSVTITHASRAVNTISVSILPSVG